MNSDRKKINARVTVKSAPEIAAELSQLIGPMRRKHLNKYTIKIKY